MTKAREILIDDMLRRYHVASDGVCDRVAIDLWCEFESWAYCFDYQPHDINAAKRRRSERMLDDDSKPR